MKERCNYSLVTHTYPEKVLTRFIPFQHSKRHKTPIKICGTAVIYRTLLKIFDVYHWLRNTEVPRQKWQQE